MATKKKSGPARRAVTLKGSPAQVAAYEAEAAKAGLSRLDWMAAVMDAAAGGAVAPPAVRAHVKAAMAKKRRASAQEKRTSETATPATVLATPSQVDAWTAAAARAHMSRQGWAFAVLDVAAGLSELHEHIRRMTRAR